MRPTEESRLKRFRAILLVPFLLCVAAIGVCEEAKTWATRGMPYAAFNTLPTTHIDVGKAMLNVAFTPGQFDLPKATLLNWITARAAIVASYYGRFPVDRLKLLIISTEGNGISHGTSFGYDGAAIKVDIGRNANQSTLDNDWVLVHEMVHLAFPSQVRTHLWIDEGIATYVEPIARAQAGQMTSEEVWRQLAQGLPKGLPGPGDQGLDVTHTWGRTYWGGALFCLLADLEIHSRTHNQRGLQDALRAIVAAGGNIELEWPLEKVLRIGDDAVGVPVLNELYQQMKAAPVDTDLTDLWNRLGIAMKDGEVIFDDDAPLSEVRKKITRPARS